MPELSSKARTRAMSRLETAARLGGVLRSAMDHCRLEDVLEPLGRVSAASRRDAAARASSRPACDSVSDPTAPCWRTRTGGGDALGEALCTSILGGLSRSNLEDLRLIGLDGG